MDTIVNESQLVGQNRHFVEQNVYSPHTIPAHKINQSHVQPPCRVRDMRFSTDSWERDLMTDDTLGSG